MDFHSVLFLLLGGVAGGFINGFAGTGTALFAMGFLLVPLDPRSAVAVVALASATTGLQGVWEVRQAVFDRPGQLARFVVPGILCVPVGVAALGMVDARTLRILIAVFLIAFGAFFGFRKALPKLERHMPRTDIAVSATGGILGGLASVSGALPMMWLSMRPWPRAEIRAVLQPYNICVLFSTVAMLSLGGAYTRETWTAFAIVFPATLLSAQLGLFAFRRVDNDRFRRILIILCLALGLGILARDLLV